MKNRKVTSLEFTRVAGYCEFVALLAIAAFVNITLAVVLLFASPVIILLIVGIKDKNFHFFQNTNEESHSLVCKDICA